MDNNTGVCTACGVTADFHGTACGWENAKCSIGKDGTILTHEHPYFGRHFNEWVTRNQPVGQTVQGTREGADLMRKAIEFALNIRDLWAVDQVGTVSADHEGEMQALSKMEEMFKCAILSLPAFAPSSPILEQGVGGIEGVILKEGDKVVLDKDFNNASVVTLVKMAKHYSTVCDLDGDKWNTMTNRLSAIVSPAPVSSPSSDPERTSIQQEYINRESVTIKRTIRDT